MRRLLPVLFLLPLSCSTSASQIPMFDLDVCGEITPETIDYAMGATQDHGLRGALYNTAQNNYEPTEDLLEYCDRAREPSPRS